MITSCIYTTGAKAKNIGTLSMLLSLFHPKDSSSIRRKYYFVVFTSEATNMLCKSFFFISLAPLLQILEVGSLTNAH